MKYLSTRGNGIHFESAEAILKGLAPDGGLFVPEELPVINGYELSQLGCMSYNSRAVFILQKFLTDYSCDEITECAEKAYNKEKFETTSIAPLYKLSGSVYLLELWHGPTCAFKDMALQILPHLMTKAMKKCGADGETVILVATSGDTGKAALEGFKDVAGTKIIVFFPQDGVSEIQRLQMVTQEGKNVYVCAVNGNFDDAQNGVKKIFTQDSLESRLMSSNIALSSANSINWGRLVPQIVYYFSAWADLLKHGEISLDDKINIAVPTGNFGNILAAYYAKRMGLPVGRLICASNCNNVLTDFINTGVYDRNRDFKTTISPSMDILISSNLERFLYDISGGDSAKIKGYMASLSKCGKYSVDAKTLNIMSEFMAAGFCDDADTLKTIKEVENKYSYVPDTHTAVAVKVYKDYATASGDNRKTIIASTANPYKFSGSVVEAIVGGEAAKGRDEFEMLETLNNVSGAKIPGSLSELKNKEVRFSDMCEPSNMQNKVLDFLEIM